MLWCSVEEFDQLQVRRLQKDVEIFIVKDLTLEFLCCIYQNILNRFLRFFLFPVTMYRWGLMSEQYVVFLCWSTSVCMDLHVVRVAMLSLSAASGTNNTQGEMINTHSLYSISQHRCYHQAGTHTHTRPCKHSHTAHGQSRLTDTLDFLRIYFFKDQVVDLKEWSFHNYLVRKSFLCSMRDVVNMKHRD